MSAIDLCFSTDPGRRNALKLIGAGLLMPLAACSQGEGSKGIGLSVVMYSNIDRVITDIIFNGAAGTMVTS